MFIFFKENSEDFISFKFNKLNFEFNSSVDSINSLIKVHESFFINFDHQQLLDSIKAHLKTLSNYDDVKLNTLSSTIYLMIGIFNENNLTKLRTGFNIELTSDMTVGAGLGSSASFAICLSAAFYTFCQIEQNLNFPKEFNTNSEVMKNSQEIISKWAFCSERIMHGNPSGLDNTICTFGNIVKFYKGVSPTIIKLKTPLNILLVDTKVTRSTMTLVENVRKLKNNHPKMIDSIIDAMGYLVEDTVEVLENFQGSDDLNNFIKLKMFFSVNNNLLRSIGVSHPVLEKIFTIAEMNNFSCKLTGAGGGGYAIILLPSDYLQNLEYNKMCKLLEDSGFEYINTTVGGSGLTIEN